MNQASGLITLHHPLHRACYAYWADRAAPGRLPARRDLDPADIPALLPWLNLIDVVRAAGARPRFRHRLVGTGITRRVGRDVTGRWFEEAYVDDWLEITTRQHRAIVENARPHLSHCNFPVAGREHVAYERLALPLAADGKTVDMILLCLVFDD